MATTDQNPSSRGRSVFLCHSKPDKEIVRQIYVRLKRHGFTPWLDEENLEAGQDWEHEIRKAVKKAAVVIVCLSKNSLTREGFVHREISLSLDVADGKPQGTVFIIPLRLEDCEVPERLGRWQWVDYFDPSGFDKLLKSLHSRVQPLVPIDRNVILEKKPQPQSSSSRSADGTSNLITNANVREAPAPGRKATEESEWEKARRQAEDEAAREKARKQATQDAEWQKAYKQAAEEVAREMAKQNEIEEAKRENTKRLMEAEWEKVQKEADRKRARQKAAEDAEWKKLPNAATIRPEVELSYLMAEACVDQREWIKADRLLKKIERLKPGYRNVDALIVRIKTQVTWAYIRAYALMSGSLLILLAVAGVLVYLVLLAFHRQK